MALTEQKDLNFDKKKKYSIILSENVQKEVDALSEEDKKLFSEAMEKIRRNPYMGEPMWGGWKMKIWNKVLWFIREIELKFKIIK